MVLTSGWKVTMSRKRLDEDLKQFAELAVRMGAVDAKAIDPKSIVVKDWVRLKCQYGCGNYGNL
jgi:predicted metal-binding protein